MKTGNSYATSTSPDGVTWTTQSSPRTITTAANYLAGIFVASGSSGTPASAIIDNVSITDLTSGSPGAVVSAEIGTGSPRGGSQESGGVYQVTSTGSDISTATSDNCRYVYFPITGSANCTLIARVVSLGGPSSMKAGVMIRDTTANGSIRMAFHVNTGTVTQSYRTTMNGSGTNATGTPTTYAKPRWLRLNRTGNVFTASTSLDAAASLLWAVE